MHEPGPQNLSRPGGRERVDTVLDMKHQRQALAAARAVFKVETIPVCYAQQFRPRAPELVEKIADRIQKEVAAFAGPAQGRRRQLVRLAVGSSLTHFLDILENKPSSSAGVHELFRRMGYAEAVAAHDLDAMRAAYQVATRDVFAAIRQFAIAVDLPPAHLATLIDAIFAYLEQLILQVTVGYLAALQGVQRPVHEARRRLLAGLLTGRPLEQLATQLAVAGWKPPELPAVLTAMTETPAYMPELLIDGTEVLVGLRRQRLTMLGGFEQIQRLAGELIAMPGIAQVAVSWPLPIDEIRDGFRWTCRLLELVEARLIVDDGVIYCADHRELLWLHADPQLSRQAGADLLAPLECEKPHHKLRLAETMLLWLQTRESAPALAGRMGIHSQTVRHRLKRLRQLFGDQLADPHMTLALLSALELTIPRWRIELGESRRSNGD